MNRKVLLGQGLYYLASGLWPLLHIRSFEAVTGPKVDRWLVKTVGALVTVIGAGLIVASRQEAPAPEAVVMSGGTATAMMLVDVIYTLEGCVSPVYLLDALPEAGLMLAAVTAAVEGTKSR